MKQENIKSVWMEYENKKKYSSLDGDLTVDVVVVGGGMAGIMTSYYLMLQGYSIAILEATRILSATTGHTTAKVTILHDLKYAYLKKKFSLENAKFYADSNQWAIEELEKIIQEQNIECDFTKTDGHLFSRTKKGFDELEKEFKVMREIGLPVSIQLENNDLPFQITGQIKLKNQALFHPRKFLFEVVEELEKNGVQIFENSRVLDWNDEKGIVKTESGVVRARYIVLATNYPIFDKAALFLRMNQMRSYALAVDLANDIPDGFYINTDEEEITLRPFQSGGKSWAIIGGQDMPTGKVGNKNAFEELEKQTRQMFDVKSVDYHWAAQDSTPIDRVPYIGKMPRTDNVYITTGFSEWGMTTSFVAGKIIADLISGSENKWSQLYSPLRIKPIADIKKTGKMVKHVVEGFGSYVTKTERLDMDSLKKEEAKIMQQGSKKIAVYKDENDNIHKVSAACTHMGCIVNFNKTEKSWDCPCHGSRFTVDGEVLNGPAIKHLKNVLEGDKNNK